MKKVCLTILIISASLAIAQQQPVTKVQTALNHLTVIEVAEPITMAAAGSEAFDIERHGTRVFVRPTKSGVSTNLFVWTEHSRSIYELQPAGDVSRMDVFISAVQQPAVTTTTDSASQEKEKEEDVAKATEQALSQTLLNAQHVNAVGVKTPKNRVSVRLEDVVQGDDAIYVRYQVTNLDTVPYRVIPPTVSVLTVEGNSAPALPQTNVQLGPASLAHFGKTSSTPVDLLQSHIEQEDVAPGKTSVGVLAIEKKDLSPQLYQFTFNADSIAPVSATAVL